MRQRSLAFAQLARQIGTHIQLVLAHWLLVVHVVKAGDLMDRDRRHAQVVSNLLFTLNTDVTLLLLNNLQASHDGRLLLISWILGHFTRKARFGFFGNYLSTSPNTMSMVPMIATASAIMWPRPISSKAARCTKAGGRILRR